MPLPTFHEIIEQAPDAILVIDAMGVIVYANPRVRQLFYRTPAELVGQSVEALVPERLRARHALERGSYIGAPRVRAMGDARVALAARRADGSEFPVEIQLAPIEARTERWTVAIVRDASDQRRVLDELGAARQDAERVARLKGEFLALAAHDLGQPVQTLELLVGMIERRLPPNSDLVELLAEAEGSLAQMRQLLKMLHDISRVESGSMQIHSEPVHIMDLFSDVERQFGAPARAKSLHFVSQPTSHVIDTDPALLRLILANLVANAIRYTQEGEVNVRSRTSEVGSLHLLVADTGIGIPPEELPHIFNDFYRVEEARRRNRDGFGLGLGVVRRLSVLLGLPVRVTSTPGVGSVFDVEIPALQVLRS